MEAHNSEDFQNREAGLHGFLGPTIVHGHQRGKVGRRRALLSPQVLTQRMPFHVVSAYEINPAELPGRASH